MPCKEVYYNNSGFINGSVCAASTNGHIAATVTHVQGNPSFPFKVYLDVWHTGSGFSGWSEIGSRTGSSKASPGTTVTFSPSYGATRTYRVRCVAYPDLSDKFTFTPDSFSHNG